MNMTDKTPGACQCHEKHAPTYWKGVVREYKDALEKAESRPLTPDAITDEMVERAWSEAGRWGHQVSDGGMSHILAAALTEPPTRPEWADGAEEIEAILREEWTFSEEDGGDDAFLNLAERLAERGVRVVGEERS